MERHTQRVSLQVCTDPCRTHSFQHHVGKGNAVHVIMLPWAVEVYHVTMGACAGLLSDTITHVCGCASKPR
jgi:hypothetical protein